MSDKEKPAESAAPAPRRTGMSLILIIASVVGVVVIEVVAAYLFLPRLGHSAPAEEGGESAEKEAAHGHGGGHEEAHGEGDHGHHASKHDTVKLNLDSFEAHAEAEVGEQSEVDLGKFKVSAFDPLTNSTLRIEFHLFGTVPASEGEHFTGLLEERGNRLRDQVIVTARSASMDDLTDPSLGLIKRRILETTNEALGEPILKSVVFADFSVVEQ